MSIETMSTGASNAYATDKATLFEMAKKLPGSKVLEGRWGIERHAIAIPNGREQAWLSSRKAWWDRWHVPDCAAPRFRLMRCLATN